MKTKGFKFAILLGIVGFAVLAYSMVVFKKPDYKSPLLEIPIYIGIVLLFGIVNLPDLKKLSREELMLKFAVTVVVCGGYCFYLYVYWQFCSLWFYMMDTERFLYYTFLTVITTAFYAYAMVSNYSSKLVYRIEYSPRAEDCSCDGYDNRPRKYLEYLDNQIDVLYDGGDGNKKRLLEDRDENGFLFRGVERKDKDLYMLEQAFKNMDASWCPIKSNMVDDSKLYAKALVSSLETLDREGLGTYWIAEGKETGDSYGIVWIEKVCEKGAEFHFAVGDTAEIANNTKEVVETGMALFLDEDEFDFLSMRMAFPSNWK